MRMLTLGLSWSPLVVGGLVVLFVLISLLLLVIVLLQRPQGGGLSEAFGASAAGAGNTAFGARVGDALTTATIVIFLAFLMTAVVLNWAVKPPENLADNVASSTDDGTTPPDDGSAPADGSTNPDLGENPNSVEVPGQDVTLQTPQGVELKQVPAPAGVDPVEKPADSPASSPPATPQDTPNGGAN